MRLHPRMSAEIDRLGPDELIRARLELSDLVRLRPAVAVAVGFHVYAAVTAAVVRRGLIDAAGGLFIGA